MRVRLLKLIWCVEYFVQQSAEIIPWLVRAAAAIIAAAFSLLLTLSPLRYLKGESPRTGNFTVHLQYPITVQSTIFPFSNEATTSSLLVFHASLLLSFSFFRAWRHWVVVFHYSQCTGSVLWQNRSLSLFPLLTEGHRAKFNTNNKITGAQNTHFHLHGGLI